MVETDFRGHTQPREGRLMADETKKEGIPRTDAGRRALLKAAAVAGGATAAAALLPGSWKKPVATIGGLPAHAQVSNGITLTAASARDLPFPNPLTARRGVLADGTGAVYTLATYHDPLGEFDDNVEVWTDIAPCGLQETSPLTSRAPFWRTGNGFTGQVSFFTSTVNTSCSPATYIAWRFSKGGRTSNTVNCAVQVPV
jgi:hypothetical protein